MVVEAPRKAEPSLKVVYLIRHAESEENVRVRAFDAACADLRKPGCPRLSDVCAALRLLRCEVDARLSAEGESQLVDVREQLEACGFVRQAGLELVVHSTRQRAARTCHALFDPFLPMLELDDLVERTPFESVITARRFKARVRRFRRWLAERAEMHIAVVGHGQFFRSLLAASGYSVDMGNAEVRQCSFDAATCTFVRCVRLFSPSGSTSSGSAGSE